MAILFNKFDHSMIIAACLWTSGSVNTLYCIARQTEIYNPEMKLLSIQKYKKILSYEIQNFRSLYFSCVVPYQR
jgi:hypothetical protein